MYNMNMRTLLELNIVGKYVEKYIKRSKKHVSKT